MEAGGPTIDLRDERGETVLEIVITVLIMGIAIVGLLAGLVTIGRTAENNARTTHVGNSAQAFAEEVKQPVLAGATNPNATYVDCATTYPAFSGTLPTSATYVATITGIEYLATVPTGPGTAPTFDGACGGAADPDLGLQRVTLEVSVTADGTTTAETMTFIKRDTGCTYSTGFQNADQGPC